MDRFNRLLDELEFWETRGRRRGRSRATGRRSAVRSVAGYALTLGVVIGAGVLLGRDTGGRDSSPVVRAPDARGA